MPSEPTQSETPEALPPTEMLQRFVESDQARFAGEQDWAARSLSNLSTADHEKLSDMLQCVDLLEQVSRKSASHRTTEIAVGSPAELDAAARPQRELGDLENVRFDGYEIRGVLGSGGFGVVYAGCHQRLDRDVAIKVPRAAVIANADSRKRFELEARASAALEHANIVRVHGTLDESVPAIVYEYCDGGTVESLVKQRDCPLPMAQVLEIAIGVASALQHAHSRGVLHRDVKPGNILLSKSESHPSVNAFEIDGEWFIPKLCDFGLAKILDDDSNATHTDMIMGTVNFMAPEQAAGDAKSTGTHTDIFAFGAVLYWLMTGRPPFQSSSRVATLSRIQFEEPQKPTACRTEISRDLEAICLKCLSKSPEDRYESAAALVTDLNRHANGQTIAARPVSVLERVWRWSRRPLRLTEAMTAVVILTFLRLATSIIGHALLLFLGEVSATRHDLVRAALVLGAITIPADLAFLQIAVRQSRRNLPPILYWGAFLASAALCVGAALAAYGLLPEPSWYQRHPGAKLVIFSLLCLSYFGQTLCLYVGDWNRVNVGQRYQRKTTKRTLLLTLLILLPGLGIGKVLLKDRSPTKLAGPKNSILLDGTNDSVRVANVGFRPGQPFTVEAWFQPADSRKAFVVGYAPLAICTVASMGQNRVSISIAESVNKIYLVDTETIVDIGDWVHVAAVYDTLGLTIYVNGQSVEYDVSIYSSTHVDDRGSIADNQVLPNPLIITEVWPGAELHFGSNDGEHFPFAGRVGEVRLSRSAHYLGPFTPSTTLAPRPDTVFLFRLDDRQQRFTDETGQYSGQVVR